MGWRQKMGDCGKKHFKTDTQYTQNAQKGGGIGAFEDIGDIERRNEKVKTPSGPVEVKMKSVILGATVDVILKPDQAMVDGVQYSNDELTDLLSRELTHDDLREVHNVKGMFEGAVVPSEEVEAFEPIARW